MSPPPAFPHYGMSPLEALAVGGVLALLAAVVAPINAWVGGNSLYLRELPAVPFPLLAWLPPAPYYWPIAAFLFYLAFRGLRHLAPSRP